MLGTLRGRLLALFFLIALIPSLTDTFLARFGVGRRRR